MMSSVPLSGGVGEHCLSSQPPQQPTCIVVGCKNGSGVFNPDVKYYQVPEIGPQSVDDGQDQDGSSPAAGSSSIARSWYINTLREDIYEAIVSTATPPAAQSYFVCIDHFDEEHRLAASSTELKTGAVPSLFEVDVFQKMIAHQEQHALRKERSMLQKQQQQQQQQQRSSVLSNLILNGNEENFLNHHSGSSEANQDLENIQAASKQVDKSAESAGARPLSVSAALAISPQSQKRFKMDPVVRGKELVERVPKAVKRTAFPGFKNQIFVTAPSASVSGGGGGSGDEMPVVKKQKAVKHTMQIGPRPGATAAPQLNGHGKAAPRNETNELSIFSTYLSNALKNSSPTSPTNGGAAKSGKSGKQTSLNFLNDILPPPIMQSTKRAPSAAPSATAKPAPEGKPAQPYKPAMTTTYIYKRITQAPEIDLTLECEEEEIIFIDEPVQEEPNEPGQSMTSVSDAIRSRLKQQDSLEEDITDEAAETSKESVEAQKMETESSEKPAHVSSSPDKSPKVSQDKPEEKPAEPSSPPKQESETIKSSPESHGAKKLSPEKTKTLAVPNGESVEDYQAVLAKYYSRAAGSRLGGKRKPRTSHLPVDLRPGDNPVQCHVCHQVLDHNIDLISHICSHLENNCDQSDAATNVYISPFEAVTTTCSVCEQSFEHPFDLIKHLDIKHMHELGEYKCRICERPHKNLDELAQHLSDWHSQEEMPYRCDACGFRTSFYADAIFHIKTEHVSTLRHFCPYCLKSLILPYNEKLGLVQSDLFYAHLITHFNKHEGTKLVPSKCTHCEKCILHVRYMRSHLTQDHSCPPSSNDEPEEEAESDEERAVRGKSRTTRRASLADLPAPPAIVNKAGAGSSDAAAKYKLRERSATSNARLGSSKNASAAENGAGTRKRRRSAASMDGSVAGEKDAVRGDQYEFRDEETEEGAVARALRAAEGRKPSSSSSNEALGVGKRRSSAKAAGANKSLPIFASDDESTKAKLKTPPVLKPSGAKPDAVYDFPSFDAPENDSADQQQASSNPASLETAAKKAPSAPNKGGANRPPSTSQAASRSARAREKRRAAAAAVEPPREESPESATISLTFCGGVRFNSEKFDFKCVECGDTCLKTHYKNAYTCHQCFYNTSCSSSFEHHLHGHLFKKRQALWNKPVKTELEIYRCPCGFTLNSETDMKSSAETGNRVAAHLLECTHKYCQVTLKSDLIETAVAAAAASVTTDPNSDESAVILESADNSSTCLDVSLKLEMPKLLSVPASLDISAEAADVAEKMADVDANADEDNNEEPVQLETTNESMNTSIETETINEKKLTE